MLDSGEQLAAAGTRGSVRPNLKLSEGDRARLVGTGKVAIVIEEQPVASTAVKKAAPSVSTKSDS